MARLVVVRHGRKIATGGGTANSIVLGFNIQGTNYYSPNLIDTDLSHTASAGSASGIQSYPSGAQIPAANMNASGQVISLPTGETAITYPFNSPEHSGQVNVSWSPANAFSNVIAGANCTVNSVNLSAGTAVVTPSHVMSDLQGWSLQMTPTFTGGTAAPAVSAIPVGQSAGLTSNFLAQINQMTQTGGTLRNMKRNSVEDNQGFFLWAQSSSRVLFPTTGILTAANRNTPSSPDWSDNNGQGSTADQWPYRKNDGEPWEVQINRANTTGRNLYFCTPWNCDTTYLQGFADVVCSSANSTVYVEISNEVWNSGYDVNTQARAEAYGNLNFMDSGTVNESNGPATAHTTANVITSPYAVQTLTTTDTTTSTNIYDSNAGAAERYCEKVCQFSKILKDRCAANGKPNAIKIVFAWQNNSASVIGTMLDYIPNKNGTATQDGKATKAHCDYVATAPYFTQGSVSTHCGPDMATLSDAMQTDIDNVTNIAQAIASAATSRGLVYMTYEGGDSVYFTPLSVSCATTANQALSGGTAFPTIDGYATSSGTRVLLKNQTTASQNGVYTVGGTATSWTLSRLADFNGANSGMSTWGGLWNANVYVQNGTINANTQWILSGPESGTIGTDSVTVTSAPGTYNGANTLGNEIYYPSGDTTTPVSVQVARNSIMYDCYMYWLDRLNHRLPSGTIITKYSNVAGVSGKYGAWGSLELSTDMEMTASALKTNRPKAAAIRDFIPNGRKLQALVGSTFAAINATVGTVVGSYKRRTFGSSVSISGTTALSIVDPNAEVLQIQVADATYFTSAGTITGNLLESDSRDPAGSRSTAISCAVIATPIWDSAHTDPGMAITNNGLTVTYQSGSTDIAKANQTGSAADKWFDVTVNNLQGTAMLVGVISQALGNWYNAFSYSTDGTVRSPGPTNLATVATFGTGDKVRWRLKNGNMYVAKWVSGAWVWQNSATPDGAQTGGWAVSIPSDGVPCVVMNGTGAQATADFSGWV